MIVSFVHKLKMITSPDAFFIFSEFWIFGLLDGARGLKEQKMAQIKKLYLTPSLRNGSSYDCVF